MTLLDAQKILEQLAGRFKTVVPSLRWKKRKNPIDTRSWYYPNHNIISLDISASVSTVLHEFAHALQNHRGTCTNHGHEFFTILLEIVEYYHGNIDKHAWKWEYPSIYRAYLKTCLTRPPTSTILK